MTAAMVQEALTSPFFQDIDRADLARLLPDLEVVDCRAGETLYAHRAPAGYLYLILEGQVAVHFRRRREDDCDGGCETRTMGPQAFIGVEAASGIEAYRNDAQALGHCRLLRFSRAAIDKLNQLSPGFRADLFLADTQGGEFRRQFEAPRRRPAPSSALDVLAWLCTLLIPAGVLWVAVEYQFNMNQSLFLSILAATVTMWIFGLVDIFVPSLFVVLAVLVLGLVPTEVALSGFASDGFFMAMSVLGLGTLLVTSGLSYRFLLAVLKVTPHNQFFASLNLLVTGMLLSPLLPSINGRAALIAPFLKDMHESLRSRPKGRAANLLAASAFAGITLFSPVFLSSKSVNFVVYGLLPVQLQTQMQWLPWLFAASVTGGVMLALYGLLAWLMYRNHEPVHLSQELVDAQMRLLGPMSTREWAAVGGVAMFGAGVVASSAIHIEPPWIALTLLYALLLSGVLRPNEFRKNIDWPFLVFMGGIVGMVNSMRHLDLDHWLAERLSWMGSYMVANFELFMLMLTLVIFLIRIVVPISATIVIVATVLIPISMVAGVNPWLVGFIVLVVGEMWFLPYQCSYYMQFRGLVPDVYDERSFLTINALMNLVKVGALYASIPFWKYLGIM